MTNEGEVYQIYTQRTSSFMTIQCAFVFQTAFQIKKGV